MRPVRSHDTIDTILAAIDAARLAPGAWIATDADGTLWATDVADRAWDRLLRERLMRPAAAGALRRGIDRAGLRASGEVHADAARLYEGYRAGVVDDRTLLEAMTACYAGWAEDELRAFGRRLAKEDITPRTYATTTDLLRALIDRGLRVAVVSGSPQVLVDEAVRALGVPALVVGVDLERDGDVLTDRLRQPVPWEEGKVQALAAHGVRAAVAFGDTTGDLALLEAAEALRVLVHPRPSLRARATAHPAWCLFTPCRTVGGHDVAPPSIDRVIV
jgi:phosphatidylglycerophosphatase C